MNRLKRQLKVLFDSEWLKLADRGMCDDIGGVEYTRVLAEFLAEDLTPMIRRFIWGVANEGTEPFHPWDREDFKP